MPRCIGTVPPLPLLLALLLAGVQAAAKEDLNLKYLYPHARGHPHEYGQSPYKFGGANRCNILPSKLKWKWHNPEGRYNTLVVGKPIIDDKRNIYLAISLGIRKFSPDGKELWKWDIEDVRSHYVMDTPAIYDGRVYFVDTSGRLVALDMETGAFIWMHNRSPDGIQGDQGFVTARDGRVFFDTGPQEPGRRNNRVVACNATNGDYLWHFEPSPGVWNWLPFFPDDDTLLLQTWNGAAYRLKVADGSVVWRNGPTDTSMFTDGGPALGPNGVFYTVSHEGRMTDIHEYPRKPGGLRAYRVSDGKLLWEHIDLLPGGIFSYPVVGRLTEGGPLVVMVGVGSLCGQPFFALLLSYWSQESKEVTRLGYAVFLAFFVGDMARRKMRGKGTFEASLWAVVIAFIMMLMFYQAWFFYFINPIYPEKGRGPWASPPYDYRVQVFDADTGAPQWGVDLPTYNWYAARGDDAGFWTRVLRGHRTMSLPSASNYPALDAQGVFYQGYQDGFFYQIKDWNNDGVIEGETEMCRFDMGTCAFTAGPTIVPGMLATVSSDGLFVFGD